MATTITNKTHRPLSVPLGRGKKLHLGPGKSGEIAASDMEHPPLKALVENGTIDIVQGRGHTGSAGSAAKGRPSHGHAPSGGPRRSGDR